MDRLYCIDVRLGPPPWWTAISGKGWNKRKNRRKRIESGKLQLDDFLCKKNFLVTYYAVQGARSDGRLTDEQTMVWYLFTGTDPVYYCPRRFRPFEIMGTFGGSKSWVALFEPVRNAYYPEVTVDSIECLVIWDPFRVDLRQRKCKASEQARTGRVYTSYEAVVRMWEYLEKKKASSSGHPEPNHVRPSLPRGELQECLYMIRQARINREAGIG